MFSSKLITFLFLCSFVFTIRINEQNRIKLTVAQGDYVDHNSVVTIVHLNTKHSLHSHKINYPNGSRQQEVTGYQGRDTNDHWILLHVKESLIGTGFMNGDIVHLKHKNTGNFLHSHPISAHMEKGQQEVSAYWTRDSNDDWILDTMGKEHLQVGGTFKLIHKNTNKALHSHPINYDFGSRQQEVTCYGGHDSNDYWVLDTKHS